MTSIHRWPLLLSGLLAVALTGCASDPQPERKQSFENEAEAFAAAEKTYRAYVDALNDVDLSDPETFEAVYAWTTGDANAQARATFSRMHADGWSVTGTSNPTVVELHQHSPSGTSLAVCVDVSAVALLDDQGRSVVHEDRPAVQSMLVSFVSTPTGGAEFLIRDFAGRDGEPSCDS